MLEQIKSWLTPPDFRDEDQNRLAQYLHAILLAGLGLLLVYIITRVVTGSNLFSPSHQIVMGLMVFLGGLLTLMRRGYLRQAMVLLLIGAWITFTYLAWNSDGVQDTAILTYIVIILIASLLLGWRVALLVALFSIAAAFLMAQAEAIGLIIPTPDKSTETARDLSLIFILVVVLNRLLINTLGTALERIEQNNRQLQALSNDLENRVIERTQVAELARQQAEAAQREAETARRLIETQMWFTTGQTELNTQMRGEQDVSVLAQKIIKQLCVYLDAPLGAIFLREGAHYMRVGSYAYPYTAEKQQFRAGEGLVGEVVVSQKTLLVAHVPPNYVSLATSIGSIQPQQLLLHPLIYENRVIGVVEMGCMSSWTARQTGFLNSVAENIAIAFHTAQTRGRIDELLMETQQQAEELQAQEEELRTTNEEWEIQAESLHRSVREWQQKKAELEATIADLKNRLAFS